MNICFETLEIDYKLGNIFIHSFRKLDLLLNCNVL